MASQHQYEKDQRSQFPDLPDILDIGAPPPDINIMGETPPAPQKPVDTVAREPQAPRMPDIAPPPPPPPDYGARQEAAPMAPEQQPLQSEQNTQAPEVQQPGVSGGSTTQQAAQPLVTATPKTEARQEIETLLSEGLTDIYQTMTPQQQEVFRQKGDEAASAIEQMMTGFKASARKVVDVIREWLSTIPGVNKFFLEQESKLKTDEILKLQRKLKKKERLNKLNIQ